MLPNLRPPPPFQRRATTRAGARLTIRSASPHDVPALGDFFAALSPSDLRFRFVTSVRKVSHDVIDAMSHPDHEQTEHLLAFVDGAPGIAASAVIAFDDADGTAEVALATRPEHERQGVGWAVLDAAAAYAASRGTRRIWSVRRGDRTEVGALERETGFTASRCPGDAALTLLQKELAPGRATRDARRPALAQA